MLYRTVPKNGDNLSILGFGAMRLPEKRGRIDGERATSQVRMAIDKGVNYVDTAMPYHMGQSEPLIGRALEDGYRERVKLATKLPPWSVKKKDDMDEILGAQLDRLQTDRIDYYLVHGLNGSSWQKIERLGVTRFLERALADGRILHAGFSFHGKKDEFKGIVDAFDWEFCQIQYNYLDEQNQAGKEGLQYAASRGLGVIIMEPLRGGNLAKRVPREVQAIWDEAEVKRTPAEWAFRWLWNHPEITVVLSGMNDEVHVEENVRIACDSEPNSLSGREIELVKRVADTYRELMKAGCTGCAYCMPCPRGVDIPFCFEAYNNHRVFGDSKHDARLIYLARNAKISGIDRPSYASLCRECGKCIEKCPQGLPIPELLRDVADDLEGPGLHMMAWTLNRLASIQRLTSLRGARRAK